MQVYLLAPHPLRPDSLIRFRVTTPPPSTVPILNLTGLILRSLR